MIVISKKANKKPKTAPLVYINRVKMTELDKNGKYTFVPVIKDANNNKVCRSKLDEEGKKKYDKAVANKINRDKRKHMILTAESELIRIIKHLSERNETVKRRDYIPDILSLKVGSRFSLNLLPLLVLIMPISEDFLPLKLKLIKSPVKAI